MRFRLALIVALIATGYVLAADLLAFCTGWCAMPASIVGSPAALTSVFSLPQVLGYVAVFVVWFVIALMLGGLRRRKD